MAPVLDPGRGARLDRLRARALRRVLRPHDEQRRARVRVPDARLAALAGCDSRFPTLAALFAGVAFALVAAVNDQFALWAIAVLLGILIDKVRVALARRLLVGVFHTMKTGEEFSLTKCLAS